jgi:hypothetical protein
LDVGDFGSAALVVEIMDVSAFCVVVGDVGAVVDAADFRGIFRCGLLGFRCGFGCRRLQPDTVQLTLCSLFVWSMGCSAAVD